MGELCLIPERTELLYGQVFQKLPESLLHRLLFMRLLQWLLRVLPPGMHHLPEKPILGGVPALTVGLDMLFSR